MLPIHVISSYVHYHVAQTAGAYAPQSVLDMGGMGKMRRFLSCQVTDANLLDKIDATCLPFPDNTFDLSLSIATLEHVEKWEQFLLESVRVCKTAAIHWFPMGRAAMDAEHLKAALGHPHPCRVPKAQKLRNFLARCGAKWRMRPLMTMGEHLLLLGTINENLNGCDVFDLVAQAGKKPYGILLTITKAGWIDDSG